MTLPMYSILLVALLMANLPFLTQKFLLFITLRSGKKVRHHLIELIIYWILLMGFAYAVEQSVSTVYRQTAAFYVIVICLFIVCAFPGFVWRYFWRSKYLA